MKPKTPEQPPENREGEAEPTMPALEQFKRERDAVATMKTDDPKRQERLSDLRVQAEFLDEDLYEHLAKTVERDPRIAKSMRERNLPQWVEIEHGKEKHRG